MEANVTCAPREGARSAVELWSQRGHKVPWTGPYERPIVRTEHTQIYDVKPIQDGGA
jgi:hypothetical protein